MSDAGRLRGIRGLVIADLTLRRGSDPIQYPVQPLSQNFALCPGLDYDSHAGTWSYESRWWYLCHTWRSEYGNLEGRDLLVVGQELPIEPGIVDRPALALDLDVCRRFAEWLEQQYDWSSRLASINYELYWPVVGEEMARFQNSPNLWTPPEVDAGHQLNASSREVASSEPIDAAGNGQ